MRRQALRLLVPGSAITALVVMGAESTTSSTATAVPAPVLAAGDFCTTDDGVTVVVDMSAFGDGIVVRCVEGPLGSSFTGWEALQGAGFSPQSVASQGGFACRLAGEPAVSRSLSIPGDEDYHEQCQRTPPQTAYWAYSYADNGARWTYSTVGAGNRSVIEGGFEGWVFSLNGSATTPAIAPSHPHTSSPTQPAASPTQPAASSTQPAASSTVTPPAPTAPAHPGSSQHSASSHPGPTAGTASNPSPSKLPTSAPITSPTQSTPTQPSPTQGGSTQSAGSPPSSDGRRPGAGSPTRGGNPRTHSGSRPRQGEEVTASPSPPQSTRDAFVTSEVPAAADDKADAGSRAPLVLGLGVLAALALGGGLTAWRRSRSA